MPLTLGICLIGNASLGIWKRDSDVCKNVRNNIIFLFQPDESLAERLWGLTEMFPDSVRDKTYTVTCKTIEGVKGFYSLSRNIVWIVVSSSVILFAPLIFEVERQQMEEMQRSQQKQVRKTFQTISKNV